MWTPSQNSRIATYDKAKRLWTYNLMPLRGDRCRVPFCRGMRQVHSGRWLKSICNKCRSRISRLNYPEKYALYEIKRRAKLKGVPFSLTTEDILSLPGYLERRGCTPRSLQIDRIKPALGYVKGNIQILTARANWDKGPNEYNDNEPF